MKERVQKWLTQPCDPRGLAVFRILLGSIMVFAVVRFWARGWIHEIYIEPTFHFTYLGFEWVRPWPGWGMYAHFALMGLTAFFVMVGAWTRLSAAAFCLLFTYAELIEKAAYLNHYYLVSLLAMLMVVVPTHHAWSVDAWRRGGSRRVGRWAYVALRSQIGVVYVFAGLAKFNADWLWHAEPLRTWLQAYSDLPLLGPLLIMPWVAFFMSWFGAVYDLTIVFWLSHGRTRAWAFGASIAFHVSIWLLFPVGVFSWVMLVSVTLFFNPEWPARFVRWVPTFAPSPIRPIGSVRAVVLVLFLLVQVLVPLRFVLFPGNVNWTEEGFRFAWRVMLIEKTGQLEYEVHTKESTVPFKVYPSQELCRLQYRMLVTQPDMIQQYAHAIARRFRADGHEHVRVHALSWAALNGRKPQPMLDPEIDLASEPIALGPSPWILPLSP